MAYRPKYIGLINHALSLFEHALAVVRRIHDFNEAAVATDADHILHLSDCWLFKKVHIPMLLLSFLYSYEPIRQGKSVVNILEGPKR
jgi:hypothetical protein